MKRRFLLATLTATAACCLAFGLSACTKAAEPEPRGITVSAAYTMATELVIPNSVTLIEVRALLNTSALTEITYNGTMAEWKAVQKESGWKTTYNIITDLTIRCTDGVLEYIR